MSGWFGGEAGVESERPFIISREAMRESLRECDY